MGIFPTNSIATSLSEAAFPDATVVHATVVHAEEPSEIEREVLRLFEEFRNPLLRYALSFGLAVQESEEIIQEVFLALMRHLQLQRSRTNLRGWIFRVAHNLALKQRYMNQKSPATTASDWTIAEQRVDPSLNPEEEAWFAQRRHRLLAVVSALPEDDQSCLRLRAEGLRYREIAEVLGMSLGSVSMSLTRSLARLARADGR